MADKALVAAQVVRDITPGLATFNDEVLFGKVWVDGRLAPRDRSLVTLSALVTLGRYGQIGYYTARGLDNGLTPTEISEILTHLAFYTGWPNAISSVTEVSKVFAERGIGDLSDAQGELLLLEPEAEAARQALVAGSVAPTAPGLAGDTDDVLFAVLWRRAHLAPRDRSLVTFVSLVSAGQVEQLGFHVNRAMDNGMTAEEAGEVLRHVAYYAGWPRSMSAVGPLKQILERRSQAMPPE